MDTAFDGLRTERLVIRRFAPADVDALLAYRNDPAIARYQGWTLPYTRDAALAFIGWLGAHHPDEAGEWYQLGIALAGAPGALLGDLGFIPDREDPGTVEVGFTLARDAQGRGYATEALAALLRYLFEDRAKHRVTARCDARNERSAALLARVGFRREGVLLAAQLEADGSRSDVALYGLLAREWRSRG